MTRVLYPGSFDPITKGHMDIIWQASNLFDEVVVAVMQNYSKKISFFSIEERLEMIKYLYRDMSNIKVISGSGATVDVAIQNECKAIIRGLRSLSDYDLHMNSFGSQTGAGLDRQEQAVLLYNYLLYIILLVQFLPL